MAEKLNQGMIMKALDYGYDKAVNGLPGLETTEELAQDYMHRDGSLQDNAKKLVRWQIAKAGTSGFITGLGGLINSPACSYSSRCRLGFVCPNSYDSGDCRNGKA